MEAPTWTPIYIEKGWALVTDDKPYSETSVFTVMNRFGEVFTLTSDQIRAPLGWTPSQLSSYQVKFQVEGGKPIAMIVSQAGRVLGGNGWGPDMISSGLAHHVIDFYKSRETLNENSSVSELMEWETPAWRDFVEYIKEKEPNLSDFRIVTLFLFVNYVSRNNLYEQLKDESSKMLSTPIFPNYEEINCREILSRFHGHEVVGTDVEISKGQIEVFEWMQNCFIVGMNRWFVSWSGKDSTHHEDEPLSQDPVASLGSSLQALSLGRNEEKEKEV